MEIDFTCHLPEFLDYDHWEPLTSAELDDDTEHLVQYREFVPYGLATTKFSMAGILDENWNIPEIPEYVLTPTSDSFRVTVPTTRAANCSGNSGYYFQPTVNGDRYQIWFTMQLYRNSGGVL